MSSKQKQMQNRLDELRKENAEVAKRRAERASEEIGDVRSFPQPRWMARSGMQGTPRSVIWLQKMAIPKKRRAR